MDNKEKEQKEQEMLKETYNFRKSGKIFMANALMIIFCIICFVKSIQYLMMDSRTLHDNEQMTMCIVMSFVFILMFILFNFWVPKLMTKLLDMADRKRKNTNVKAREQIYNLHSALQKMSGSQGVIVWDTICAGCLFFVIVPWIINYTTSNNVVIFGIIIFLLILFFGGHKIGTNMGRIRRFDKRLCKYTKLYMDISDENTYIAEVDASIKKGVIAFTGYWLLTDDYMLGRLSDISYEPIAIPRSAIIHSTFFFERSTDNRGLPIGILRLQLNNGKHVEFTLGRGNACSPTLHVLNEQRIPWSKEEMRYSVW